MTKTESILLLEMERRQALSFKQVVEPARPFQNVGVIYHHSTSTMPAVDAVATSFMAPKRNVRPGKPWVPGEPRIAVVVAMLRGASMFHSANSV